MRPAKFVERGCYKDVETLCSYFDYYEDLRRPYKKKPRTSVKPSRFRLLSVTDEDVHPDIHKSLNAAGNLPFDQEKHVIFEYVGLKNKYQRICNRDFFEEVVKPYTGRVSERHGYLMFNNLGDLHNLALGRKRGNFKKDKLQSCHGMFCHLN